MFRDSIGAIRFAGFSVSLVSSLLVISTSAAQEPNIAFLQGLEKTHYHRIESAVAERTYHLFVRVPELPEPGETYQTIYLMDGGMTFPLLAAYYNYLKLGEEVPEAIIVGVSYGTDDWQQGNMRSTDYTAKSEERSFWGGAGDFQRILADEIMPLVEGKYPSDPSRRILFGQSIGGQFVLYTAMTAPDLFWGYVASNPALHRNLELFLTLKPVAGSKVKPRLFVSSGSNDEPVFRKPATTWMEHWTKRTDLPWALRAVTLEGQSHFSAAPAAFREGLRWILSVPD